MGGVFLAILLAVFVYFFSRDGGRQVEGLAFLYTSVPVAVAGQQEGAGS